MNNAIKVAEERDARRLQKKYDEYVSKYEQIKKEKDERRAEEERERRRLLAEQEEERKRLLAEQKRKEKINELTVEKKQLEKVVAEYYDRSAEINKLSNEIRTFQQRLMPVIGKINSFEKHRLFNWELIMPAILIGFNVICSIINMNNLGYAVFLCIIFFKPAILLGGFIDESQSKCYVSMKGKKQRLESEIQNRQQIVSEIQAAKSQYEDRKKNINELELQIQRLQFEEYTE